MTDSRVASPRWYTSGKRSDWVKAMGSDMRSIIRAVQGRRGQPSAVTIDGHTLQRSRGGRAGYDGYKLRK